MKSLEITAKDGVTIRGVAKAGSNIAAIFLHEQQTDLDAWHSLPHRIAGLGWTVVAIDLRGHGGSERQADRCRAQEDISAVLRETRKLASSHTRPPHIVIVAAGESAIDALRVSAHEKDIEALVLLSPGPVPGGEADDLRGVGIAKAFLYGKNDSAAPAFEQLARRSIGWTVSITFPTDRQGTDLISDWGDHVFDQIVGVTLPVSA
jgi:pimeloyl-ACP methyl ester carboxylesterase